jgi:hypothetical protein
MTDVFTAVLYDPFYDETDTITIEADDLEAAIDMARDIADDRGIEVDEVAAPDGETAMFSTGHTYDVEQVTVVHNAAGEPTTEVIHAVTYEMAYDLAELMFGEGTIISLEARGITTAFRTASSTDW